ncbi:hypothetical protein [Massilia sp. TWR1-2-2]|uniref:hypothetical protein n=1 Tax=Massilia sp. TWR1-2-2 TaxID=2804584 RepID=UPI003CFA180B
MAGLVAGVSLVAAPANEWHLFEIGFGASDAFARGHIAGAGYTDTARFEHGPLWNKASDTALERLLLEHGIRHDTTVVLYGRNRLAAAKRGAPDAVCGSGRCGPARWRLRCPDQCRTAAQGRGDDDDVNSMSASLAFFCAWLMNWERIAVYDGGCCEWSLDPDNPVICRAHGADRKALGA